VSPEVPITPWAPSSKPVDPWLPCGGSRRWRSARLRPRTSLADSASGHMHISSRNSRLVRVFAERSRSASFRVSPGARGGREVASRGGEAQWPPGARSLHGYNARGEVVTPQAGAAPSQSVPMSAEFRVFRRSGAICRRGRANGWKDLGPPRAAAGRGHPCWKPTGLRTPAARRADCGLVAAGG